MDVALIRRVALIESKILFLNTCKEYFNELSDLKELSWINQEALNVIKILKKSRLFDKSAIQYVKEEFELAKQNIYFVEKEISSGIESIRLFKEKILKLEEDETISLQDFEKIECDFKSIITANENRFSHLENYFYGEQWNEDGTIKQTILEVVAYLDPNNRSNDLNLIKLNARALKGFTKREGIWYEQLTNEQSRAKELLTRFRSNYEHEHERLLEAYRFCECGDIDNAVSIYDSCTGVIRDNIHEVVANSIHAIHLHLNTISKNDALNKLRSKTNEVLKIKNPSTFAAVSKYLVLEINKLKKELKSNLAVLDGDYNAIMANNSRKYILNNLSVLGTLLNLLSKREKRLLKLSFLLTALILSIFLVSVFYVYSAWIKYKDPSYRFELGKSMIDSNGVSDSASKSKAFYHVKYAADHEYPPAFLLTSSMYANGKGVEANNYLAFYYAKKASDYGTPTGKYTLALIYDEGIFKNTHDDYMLCLYEEAATEGDLKAVEKLEQNYESIAESYLQGRNGCYLDREKGFKLLKKSADLGNPSSSLKVADMYLNGIGVQKNNESAFKYYYNSYILGNKNAAYNLGLCYLHAIGTVQDIKIALQYLVESGKNLDTESNILQTIVSIAADYIKDTSINSQLKGLRILNTAAELGNKQAKDVLINQFIKDPDLLDIRNYKDLYDSWLFSPTTQNDTNAKYITSVKSLADFEFGQFLVGWNQEKSLKSLAELAESDFYKSHLAIGLMFLSQLKFDENVINNDFLRISMNFFIAAYSHGISEASFPIVEIINHLSEDNSITLRSYCKAKMPDGLFQMIDLKINQRTWPIHNEIDANLIDKISLESIGCKFGKLNMPNPK